MADEQSLKIGINNIDPRLCGLQILGNALLDKVGTELSHFIVG